MPHPYSEDLRLRVAQAVERGKTTREVSALFQVNPGFVSKIHQLWRRSGTVPSKPIGGYRRAILEPYAETLMEQITNRPSITLKELQNWLEQAHALSVSIPAIDKFIRQKLGFRYKKTLVAAAREQWQAWQQHCDISRLVFLDETGMSTDMRRRYGRRVGGARCVDSAPAGHWQTLTFMAGLRADRITAPWYGDRAMKGEAFKEYLGSQLGPTLKPGDSVICDNLPAHKVAEVEAIIAAQGATLNYWPPYSPDLNPIEQVFAKLKALLRKAAERTVDKLWQSLGAILYQVNAEECLNFFRNSGYVSN
ncbi:MAG: IS630 family transposase [Methylobacter sp.]